MRRMIFAILIAMILPTPGFAIGSLEEGMTDLARQIVEKTSSDQTVTIGISTFPHADNACSELSNYMADLLVVSMFEVGSGRVQIVERAQLTTIFEELKFSRSGAVDTDTAKELGKIYGVDALVIGSITEIGDEMAVVARLISTETGAVFSAARSSFPKTGTVEQLMANRSFALCGFGTAAGSTGVRPVTGQSPIGRGAVSAEPIGEFTTEQFIARIVRASYDESSKRLTLVVRFQSTSEKPIYLSYIPKTFAASDENGMLLRFEEGNLFGIRTCASRNFGYCASHSAYTTEVQAGKTAQVTISGVLQSNAPRLVDAVFELIIVPDQSNTDDFSTISIGFHSIPVWTIVCVI